MSFQGNGCRTPFNIDKIVYKVEKYGNTDRIRRYMISLEQWRALVAVVDAGGYTRAADALNKTQSSVTYAVQKVESLLGVKAFEIRGRRARLTPVGEVPIIYVNLHWNS